jgi:hypothetical protein
MSTSFVPLSPLDNLGDIVDIPTPLAPARPNATVPESTNVPAVDASNAAAVVDNILGTSVGNSVAKSGTNAVGSGLIGSFETWLTSSTANIVAVLVGLVLIAGAIWGLDQVRETVVSTARGAAELAA